MLSFSMERLYRWGIFPLWMLLTATIFFRSPIPIDETRYLSVAWEMWLRGDFLVPYLNGHTYSHKPPLLFWLFQLGWAVLGVNEWWPRLVGPLCALVNLLLIRRLAGKLWPDAPWIALKVPWILLATLLWTLFATSTMFDILLTDCVLLGMIGLHDVSQGQVRQGWWTVALAVGLGLLAKGPVIFLHVLPTSFLLFAWRQPGRVNGKAWYAGLLVAMLAGCLMALAWALPAAIVGGEEYGSAILWHQTADRTVNTKIHARSFGWYLPFLPLMVFPWITWPRLWQNLQWTAIRHDLGVRFCLTWLLATLLVFSCLPSKQLHYLIPLLPAFALLVGRFLCERDEPRTLLLELLPAFFVLLIGVFLMLLPQVPGLSNLNWVRLVEPYWGVSVIAVALLLAAAVVVYFRQLSVAALSVGMVLSVFIGFIFFFQYTGLQYNLRPAAMLLKQYMEQGIPTAFVGDYQGQFNFLGRFSEPLPVIARDQVNTWSAQHPQGYLIFLEKNKPGQAAYLQPHREHWLVLRSVEQMSSVH